MKIRLVGVVLASSFLCYEFLYGGALVKDFKKGKSSSEAIKQSVDASSENVKESSEENSSSTDNQTADDSAEEDNKGSVSKKEIKGDPVVAKIGRSKEYRRSDVLKIIKSLPPRLTQGVSEDRLFAMCLDQLISSYLMVEQAKKAGMDKTKEFADRLENMRNDLLARMFLLKEVAPKAENESALKARYTKYLVDFKKVKETQISRIMLASEDEAKAVIKRLDKGENFGKVAKEKSLAPSKEKGGDEGYIAISALPSPIKEKLAVLKKGEYTKEALKTENGYHVFKAGDSKDSSPQKFEEVKETLKQLVVQEEIVKLMDRLAKQFDVVRFKEDGSPIKEAPKAPDVSSSSRPDAAN